jgi:exopolysaccharide biosynthesis polyprenyl glycosylphosphotransferase
MYSHNLLLERIQRALVDGIAVFTALLVAVAIRDANGWISSAPSDEWTSYLFPAAVIAALTVFVVHLSGSYREPYGKATIRILVEVVGSAALLALVGGLFYGGEPLSWQTAVIFVPAAVLLVTGLRLAYRSYVNAVWRTRSAIRRVLIVGRTESGQGFAKALAQQPAYYEMIGFVDDAVATATNGSRADLLGTVAELGRIIEENQIDEVVICLPNDLDRSVDVIGECMKRKVTWRAMPNLFGLRLERVSFDSFGGVPLVGLHNSHPIGFGRVLKRGFDIVVAGIALILIAPILLIVAVIVRVTSRGPALFKQTRVGIDEKPFTMLKFRSMRIDSAVDLHDEYTRQWIHGKTGASANGDGGGETDDSAEIHKITDDPRVTPVGKFLRATSLDELPQFWNVLRGDMSVVGPRPALPYEVERYTEWHKRRLTVNPGITGAWQVSGRSDLSFEEMVALDIDYIETWSIERDLEVVLKTLPAILKFRGN